MKNNHTRFGAICAFLVGISYIAIGILYFILRSRGQVSYDSLDGFLTSVSDGSGLLQLYYWIFAVGALLAIAVVQAVSDRVQSGHESSIRWLAMLATIGFAVHAASYLILQDHSPKLAELYVAADESARTAIVALGVRSLDPDGLMGFGLVGLWILVVSWLAIKGGHFPKILAIIGILGGILYILVAAGFILDHTMLIAISAGLGGIVIAPIWYIWIGFVLMGAESQEE